MMLNIKVKTNFDILYRYDLLNQNIVDTLILPALNKIITTNTKKYYKTIYQSVYSLKDKIKEQISYTKNKTKIIYTIKTTMYIPNTKPFDTIIKQLIIPNKKKKYYKNILTLYTLNPNNNYIKYTIQKIKYS